MEKDGKYILTPKGKAFIIAVDTGLVTEASTWGRSRNSGTDWKMRSFCKRWQIARFNRTADGRGGFWRC